MTEEGEEKAQLRWLTFQKGWNTAVKACAKKCEDLDWSQDSTWQAATLDCAEAILELESK
jgi:hypothetical protein